MKAKAFPQGLGENSVRFEQTALHYVTPDSLWSLVALIRCMRLSYGKAHKWLCLVQRDRKFGYAPVGGCVANLRHPVFLCQSELGIAAVEHLPSPIYGPRGHWKYLLERSYRKLLRMPPSREPSFLRSIAGLSDKTLPDDR
jgi:hypothetical protein